jgi:hypothetical protein
LTVPRRALTAILVLVALAASAAGIAVAQSDDAGQAEPTLPPGVEVRKVGEGPKECNIQLHEPLPANERPEEIVCFETDLNGVPPAEVSDEALTNDLCGRIDPEVAARASWCRDAGK